MADLNKPKYFDVDRLYWYLQNNDTPECIKAGILKASELKPEPEKHESPETLKKAEDRAREVEQYLVR